MITITIRKDEVLISGHAGYGEPGKDIVCAGVSALAQTLLLSLEYLSGDWITVQKEAGYMSIRYQALSRCGLLLLQSFLLGAREMEKQYPDNLQFQNGGYDVALSGIDDKGCGTGPGKLS